MKTREIAEGYRLSHWAKIVEERNSSGLSIRAYCQGAGVHENTYYYWLRKLRETVAEEISANQGDPREPMLAKQVFAELKLPASPNQPSTVINREDQVCIEAAGIRLTAGGEYPVAKLTELLGAVRRLCY